MAPLALAYVLLEALRTDLGTPYGGYPTWMLLVFGWGAAVAVVVVGFAAARMRWRSPTALEDPDSTPDAGTPTKGERS